MEWLSIDPLSWPGIFVSSVAGGIIGLERQIAGKPVGVRTSALICLGTYVFVALGVALLDSDKDPTRVLGQVVTGIGFLGAGVMMSKNGTIHGVTSAASIWTLAGIGAAVGFGYFNAAVVVSIVVVSILVGIDKLEATFLTLRRGTHKRGGGD